jgi:hypothetical protein
MEAAPIVFFNVVYTASHSNVCGDGNSLPLVNIDQPAPEWRRKADTSAARFFEFRAGIVNPGQLIFYYVK